MSKDLYSNDNDFLKEDIRTSMLHEFEGYKKHKKSKKKRKKKQKKLQNRRMRKLGKKLNKKLEKKLKKKYRKKFEKYKHSSSTEMYEKIIKRLICEVISQRIIKSPDAFIGLDEAVIDVPCKEVNK